MPASGSISRDPANCDLSANPPATVLVNGAAHDRPPGAARQPLGRGGGLVARSDDPTITLSGLNARYSFTGVARLGQPPGNGLLYAGFLRSRKAKPPSTVPNSRSEAGSGTVSVVCTFRTTTLLIFAFRFVLA